MFKKLIAKIRSRSSTGTERKSTKLEAGGSSPSESTTREAMFEAARIQNESYKRAGEWVKQAFANVHQYDRIISIEKAVPEQDMVPMKMPKQKRK